MGSLKEPLPSFPPRAAGSAVQASLSMLPEHHPSPHKHCSQKCKGQCQESEDVTAPKGLVLLSLLFHWPRVITFHYQLDGMLSALCKVSYLILSRTLEGTHFCLHLTDEEAEAQKVKKRIYHDISNRMQSWKVAQGST